jgi:hypothetical protein
MLDALEDLLHPVKRWRWVLSRRRRRPTMALAICVGFGEGCRVGRVTRHRRGGRADVMPLVVEEVSPGVVLPIIHRRGVEACGLDATIAVPVVVVNLGGRHVGEGSGSRSGSARIHRWLLKRRRFKGCGMWSDILEAGLFQRRRHGLLLFLRQKAF